MSATTESAGVTPVEAGVTPEQSDDQATGTAAPAEPATGEGDGLKRALDAERAQRRELEKALKAERAQREALETSQLSEHEQAIAQARKDAATETVNEWSARLRRSEVRRELAAAGAAPDLLDEIARSDAFADLEIDQDGQVVDLGKAVVAYRGSHPSAFAAPRAAAGNFDGGSGGSPALQSWTRDQIGAMDQREYERLEPEIMRAMREGRIRD